LEAGILLKAAARLQSVREAWPNGRSDLDGALTFNRKLWTIFLDSALSKDSQLPEAVRKNIATLGVFVMRQTLATTSDPNPERLAALININREIAAGLRGQG
jgi:flagellar protein FlaF